MNEIKIETGSSRIISILVIALVGAGICGSIIFYYRGADGKLERELDKLEGLNVAIASEARQLQAGIASHSLGIKAVGSQVGVSRERIERVHTEIEQSANDAERAISIIGECEEILTAIKAQKSR